MIVNVNNRRRSFQQITDTMSFEFQKNLTKLKWMLVALTGIFLLFFALAELQEMQGIPLPSLMIDYINPYLGLIAIMILVVVTTFGSSIIAEDYSTQTRNLLFPKITKKRLFLGRFSSLLIYSAIPVIFYYLLIGFVTSIKYNQLIPIELFYSLGWAMLYTFLLLAFVTFLSSIMKSTSQTVVVGLLSVFIVFNLLTRLLMFTGVTVEPFFIITYYSNIITASLNMPVQRFVENAFGMGGGSMTFTNWVTPDVIGALVGITIYTGILLSSAYYFFRRRNE